MDMQADLATRGGDWKPFEFTGRGQEYFGIWIVNILLTIVTLGIYSAWAKVRTERYFHGHTRLLDSSFEYTAQPLQILKGRIIAVGLFLAYWLMLNVYPQWSLFTLGVLCLMVPFILVASMAFRMRNTVYRNIRFRFQPDYLGAYRMFIVPILVVMGLTAVGYSLFAESEWAAAMEMASAQSEQGEEFHIEDMIFTFFMLALLPVFPLFDYLRRRFIISRVRYGKAEGSFHGRLWWFYRPYLAVAILGAGLMAFFILGTSWLFDTLRSGGMEGSVESTMPFATGAMIVSMLLFYCVGFFVAGYLKARLTNLTYNNSVLGPVNIRSHLMGRRLGWIYLSNTVAIIVSLGLLIPWAKVRMARYVASCTEVRATDMESIRSVVQDDRSPIGEEVGEVFDFDLAL